MKETTSYEGTPMAMETDPRSGTPTSSAAVNGTLSDLRSPMFAPCRRET